MCVVASIGCNTEHKPSHDELQAENEELREKMSEALSKIEDAENHLLRSLKDEIAQAQDDASYRPACKDAEDAVSSAESDAADVQSSLDEAKSELE